MRCVLISRELTTGFGLVPRRKSGSALRARRLLPMPFDGLEDVLLGSEEFLDAAAAVWSHGVADQYGEAAHVIGAVGGAQVHVAGARLEQASHFHALFVRRPLEVHVLEAGSVARRRGCPEPHTEANRKGGKTRKHFDSTRNKQEARKVTKE